MPLISVIMPVYNGELYLKKAINCILQQTLSDFEFIIIDDGSTDKTKSIIQACDDKRICYLYSAHEGIAHALNYGLSCATGKYIARMDADDICAASRFEKEIAFLTANPDISFVCCHPILMGMDESWDLPTRHEEIRANLLFSNCIIHSAVMWRRDDFEKHHLYYSADYPHAEDYELWTRAVSRVRLATLKDRLLTYRIHTSQVSHRFSNLQVESANRIHKRLLKEFGIVYTKEELFVHDHLWSFLGTEKLNRWFERILRYNQTAAFYDQSALSNVIGIFKTYEGVSSSSS